VKKLRNKNKAGFTLIELLVVIAIIGLLASVVLLALNGARAKARDAKRIADIRQLASAMELYYNDNNTYPTSNTSAIFSNIGTPTIAPNYIGTIPTAPNPPDGSCASAPNGGNYYWIANGTAQTNSYAITFCLGQSTGGLTCTNGTACVHTLSPIGIQ
jgi:prepilin-type N-terminal cleavage/methylation domain-containing protein